MPDSEVTSIYEAFLSNIITHRQMIEVRWFFVDAVVAFMTKRVHSFCRFYLNFKAVYRHWAQDYSIQTLISENKPWICFADWNVVQLASNLFKIYPDSNGSHMKDRLLLLSLMIHNNINSPSRYILYILSF